MYLQIFSKFDFQFLIKCVLRAADSMKFLCSNQRVRDCATMIFNTISAKCMSALQEFLVFDETPPADQKRFSQFLCCTSSNSAYTHCNYKITSATTKQFMILDEPPSLMKTCGWP